jgi:hypothetical protein
MVLESLCPKVEYPVMVLEYINVTDTSFVKPQERYKEVLSSGIGRCGVKLSTPRKGYTRGKYIQWREKRGENRILNSDDI